MTELTNPVKLHLGCWHRRLPGYTGVDCREDAGADVVADVRDLGQWDNGEVAEIYACHVLEHIPRPEVLPMLREWRRVLQPGGILRISVPSFTMLSDLYRRGVPLCRLIGALCGRQDYPENTHYSVYDYHYLAWLLTQAGFHSIDLWEPEDWQPEGYDDYSRAVIDGISISLNLGAIRG